MRKRRHALALNLISDGPLVIMLAPDRFLSWTEHRRAMLAAVRVTFALSARRVFSIEALAGFADPDPGAADDSGFLARCQLAASGATNILPDFNLFTWDEAASGYRLARAATI